MRYAHSVGQLSWLIVHGATAWKVALAGAAVLGALAAVILRYAKAWRRARLTRVRLGTPAAELDGLSEGEMVTIQGRLEARPPLGQRYEDGREAAIATVELFAGRLRRAGAASWRAAGIAVRSGDRVVECEGDLQVVLGSTETPPYRRLHPLDTRLRQIVGDAVGAMPSAPRVSMRSVQPGDEVLVRGRLRLAPATGEAGYRGRTTRWVLEHESAPMAVAYVGRVPVSRPCGAALGGAALVAAMALFASFVVGMLGLEWGAKAGATVAAATPFHREAALRELRDKAKGEVDVLPRLDKVERLAALELQIAGCDEAVKVLADHGEFRRAAELGERCTDPAGRERAVHAWHVLNDRS